MAARPLLLHSVSYSGSWGQASLTLDQFIHKAAELGFDGVMLGAKRPHLSVLDYGPASLLELHRTILDAGLRHVLIAGYTNFTADAEHGEVPHLEFQINHVEQLARMADALGGKMVRVFTGYDHPALSYGAAWARLVSALRECAVRAYQHGVVIGVQNHHDMACGWETLHDLIAAIDHPNCKAMYDAWAPALQSANLEESARKMAPLTIHTTVADYQLRPRFRYQPQLVNYVPETPYVQAVPMGEGFIDYPAFFRGLGEDVPVAYEMCSPLLHGGTLATLDDYAKKFIAYMKALPS